MFPRTRYHVPAVNRSGSILRTVAASDKPLGIGELSRMLQLPKASVFRIVATLEDDGFLERVDGDRFAVGPTAFEVGIAYAAQTDLQSVFRSVAQQLIRDHNETVQLAVLAGTDIFYLAKEESSQPVRLVSTLGTRLPASSTSLGKAMLACLTDDEISSLFEDKPLTQLTPRSHACLTELIEDLKLVRSRGWAHDNEEASPGLQCVGAAICDRHGRPMAAISISVPSQRISDARLVELGESAKRAAAEISTLIQYGAIDAPAAG